jgi:hypothetical protein
MASMGFASQQNGASPPYAVPGPEATDLISRVRGWIVMSQPVGGIQTIRLPGLESATPREPDTGLLPVHIVSNPDSMGRIAFVENDMMNKRHALALLDADGKTEPIFEAPGDALWDHTVGGYLAFAPDGTRVALVARGKGVQNHSPDAYLKEGELEIWRLDERQRISMPMPAYDDMMAWFPDGKRLLYTAFVASAEGKKLLRTHVKPEETFGLKTAAWERVPVIHVLDTESGQSRALHVGERPIVSPDGRLVILRDFELHWRVLDLESNQSKPFEAVGSIYPGAIAFVDPNTVLYWAWPTEGSEAKYTEHNSPLVGAKQMRALKLVDLRDGRFQTVVPFVDPRRSVSFGAASP